MINSLAILAAKLATKLNRVTGSGGTALPGLVAKKLSPNILVDLTENNFPKGIIVVTGTNGKTTTSRFIASILEEAGISFLHNRAGSNLERGIIASLVEQSDLKGNIEAKIGIFEVDEAWVPTVCKQIKPAIVVVTNLFRDQLDRYGELDSIAENFQTTFEQLKNTKFVLNADDPLVASLALNLEDRSRVYFFGVNNYGGPKLEHDHTADSIFSPISQEVLNYRQQYFSHIGIYRSRNRDFTRPNPEYAAKNILQIGIKSTTFDVEDTTYSIKLPLAGLFNVYNAIAAYAVGSVLEIQKQTVVSALESSAAAFGRSEEINYNNKKWLLLLIKNPTGFNQIIQAFLLRSKQNTLWVIINDNIADGRDVSWLWDAAIEDLAGYESEIMVSGTRAYDMALRFKYANIDCDIEPNIEKALEKLAATTGKRSKILVLPTYTAMRELRSELVKLAGISREYKQ